MVVQQRDPGGAERQEGIGPRPWPAATDSGREQTPGDAQCGGLLRHWKRQEGRKPATVDDLREGKPLKAARNPMGVAGAPTSFAEPTPEGLVEEQVAEAVRNGTSGTTAGRGTPASGGLTNLMRRRGAKPTRGAPHRDCILRFHFPKEPARTQVTEEAANSKRDDHEQRENAEGQHREVQGRGRRDEGQRSP